MCLAPSFLPSWGGAVTRIPKSKRRRVRYTTRDRPRTPREPGRGGSFSAAACRRIRHAAALAEEMGNVHSIKAYGVVWTIHRLPCHPGQEATEVGRSDSRPRDSKTPASSATAAQSGARCRTPRPMRGSRFVPTPPASQHIRGSLRVRSISVRVQNAPSDARRIPATRRRKRHH